MIGALVAAAGALSGAQRPVPAPAARADSAMRRPIVIAHRGASGHRPEHTLAAYTLAIDQGADFVEPDLVVTKDGALIARHENEIGGTTDAARKFPDRRTTRRVDGEDVTGWFAEDFTLAEIKTLRARERLALRSHAYDGRFDVPTLDEVIALVRQKSAALGRAIGIYPETKHPTYFRSLGRPIEERLVEALERAGWSGREAPAIVQSFEPGSLRRLRGMTRVRLVQLLDARGQPYDFAAAGDPRTYAALATPAGLREIASYADGVGPHKRLVIPAGPDGRLLPPTSIVADAHEAGLVVDVWTLRDEPAFLAPDYQGDPLAEYRQLAALGVDGIFTDFPNTAARALGGGAGP